jgi:hypothetical protein
MQHNDRAHEPSQRKKPSSQREEVWGRRFAALETEADPAAQQGDCERNAYEHSLQSLRRSQSLPRFREMGRVDTHDGCLDFHPDSGDCGVADVEEQVQCV